MDHLIRISDILSSCLTTEALQSLNLTVSKGNEASVAYKRALKHELFVGLLEHSGRIVVAKLNRELAPDEVMLIYNRVNQFLTARGYD